jgi:hypothetical protein
MTQNLFSKPVPQCVHERGQAMSEFLIALAVLLPLFLAVTYAGRYGDLQQQATQASRYAAFQRALEPSESRLPTTRIEDQMRARFFVGAQAVNDGRIRSDDSAAAVKASTMSPMWKDVHGQPLLASPMDVSMRYAKVKADSGAIEAGMEAVTQASGKSWSDGQAAQVEVRLVNKLNMREDITVQPLVLAATTATIGDDLASAGNADTQSSAETLSPKRIIPSEVDYVMDAVFFLFERCAPQLDWDPPDAVPKERLSTYRAVPQPCH